MESAREGGRTFPQSVYFPDPPTLKLNSTPTKHRTLVLYDHVYVEAFLTPASAHSYGADEPATALHEFQLESRYPSLHPHTTSKPNLNPNPSLHPHTTSKPMPEPNPNVEPCPNYDASITLSRN